MSIKSLKEILNKDLEYSFDITNEKKIEIILTKYNQYWNGMIIWEDKAFNTSKWFSGIVLALISYFIGRREGITIELKIVLIALIFIFGISTLVYLFVCIKSYYNNYVMSIYTESILKLYKEDEYVVNNTFFPKYFKNVVKVRQLSVLVWVHFIMIITSSVGILLI